MFQLHDASQHLRQARVRGLLHLMHPKKTLLSNDRNTAAVKSVYKKATHKHKVSYRHPPF